MRPTRLIVDINEFKNNIDKIKKFCPNKEIMPVFKARAYGTDIDMLSDITNSFNIVAVAMIDEALALRNFGYKNEIFILNQPYKDDIEDIIENIIENDISIGISDLSFIKELFKHNRTIKVHLEIETGMNRTGIKVEDVENFCKLIKEHENVKVEGVYTHFACADFDDEYTNKQIEKFKNAVEIVKKYFEDVRYIHCSASSGILNYNNDFTNLVRPGIILYGYEPFENAKSILPVQPICKLETKVVFLKQIEKGEKISYGSTYEAQNKRMIATIPIGYADGIRRKLSNKGYVSINNKKAPIVGNICMDSMMIDVTDIPNVEVGTKVYIWDNNLITLDEIARECDTINYEILSTISYRVHRYFLGL